MMKLRRNHKIDPVRLKGLLADTLPAISAGEIGALLIAENEKDFKLINEVIDFGYIVVE